jgi:hypothetical protein
MYSPAIQTSLIQSHIEDLRAARHGFVPAGVAIHLGSEPRQPQPSSVVRAISRWFSGPVSPGTRAAARM